MNGIVLLRVVQPRHQVGIRLAAPVAVHAIHKGLPIARRPARIDHHHHIAIRRKQLRIPAIRPRIAPSPLRPPMNQQLRWVFFVRVVAGGGITNPCTFTPSFAVNQNDSIFGRSSCASSASFRCATILGSYAGSSYHRIGPAVGHHIAHDIALSLMRCHISKNYFRRDCPRASWLRST